MWDGRQLSISDDQVINDASVPVADIVDESQPPKWMSLGGSYSPPDTVSLTFPTAGATVYLAVVADSSDLLIPNKVVGFGAATFVGGDANGFSLQRLPSAISPLNASGSITQSLDDPIYLDASTVRYLFGKNKDMPEAVLAPVLVR
jgi:hypothetical protein